MRHDPVIGVFQETIDEVYHHVYENFASWQSQDAAHDVEGDTAEAKRVNEQKRWGNWLRLRLQFFQNWRKDLIELAFQHLDMKASPQAEAADEFLEMSDESSIIVNEEETHFRVVTQPPAMDKTQCCLQSNDGRTLFAAFIFAWTRKPVHVTDRGVMFA
jgi:hypothetical protein